MENFHARLDQRIQGLGLTYKAVDKLIGKRPGYVSNMLGARSDPSGSAVAALALALDTTPNDLFGIAGRYQILDQRDAIDFVNEQAQALVDAARNKARETLCAVGGYPPVQEVYKWAANCGNVIDTTEDVARFFTTYTAPNDHQAIPQAAFVGVNSLARNSLGTIDAGSLNSLISKMPNQFVRGLVRDQLSLSEGTPRLSCERIPVNIPDAGVDVDFRYLRLYLKLRDKTGNSIVLNYSEPLD